MIYMELSGSIRREQWPVVLQRMDLNGKSIANATFFYLFFLTGSMVDIFYVRYVLVLNNLIEPLRCSRTYKTN